MKIHLVQWSFTMTFLVTSPALADAVFPVDEVVHTSSITKGDVTIKVRSFSGEAVDAISRVDYCDQDGRLIYAPVGVPAQKVIPLTNKKQIWFEVSIRNDGEHIVSITSLKSRLMGARGQSATPYTQKQLVKEAAAKGRCYSPFVASADKVDFLALDFELLPGVVVKGLVGFSADILKKSHGSFVLYDIPTKTDASGNVIKKSKFSFIAKNQSN